MLESIVQSIVQSTVQSTVQSMVQSTVHSPAFTLMCTCVMQRVQLLTNQNQPRMWTLSHYYKYLGGWQAAYICSCIRLRLVYPSELVSLCVVFVFVYTLCLPYRHRYPRFSAGVIKCWGPRVPIFTDFGGTLP